MVRLRLRVFLLLMFLTLGGQQVLLAQVTNVFIAKKDNKYWLVDMHLPMSKNVPNKLNVQLAKELFGIENSTVSQACDSYSRGLDKMMKPSPDLLKKCGKKHESYKLTWLEYEEGKFISVIVEVKRINYSGEVGLHKKKAFFYDLKHNRRLRVGDVLTLKTVTDFTQSYGGTRYEPYIKKKGKVHMMFRQGDNMLEAEFDPLTHPEYFQPSFLELLGYEVKEPIKTAPTVVHKDLAAVSEPTVHEEQVTVAEKKEEKTVPAVVSSARGKNTFVVIIANEHYQEEQSVEFAQNDGEQFRKCCVEVLGIPDENIHFRKDATLNQMRREIHWLKDVAEAYQGEAHIIVYYAGHGMPDEATQYSYLLPVDGVCTSVITGYKLDTFYEQLAKLKAKDVLVLLDACFSGANRGKGMLASSRGVALKPKSMVPDGNLIVFSAAQGDETAYPFREKLHGLFTYYLLEKLNNSKGDLSLGELQQYVSTEVLRKSVVINRKRQTPSISTSNAMGNVWQNIKLK